MKHERLDVALRTLILVAGTISAVLLSMKGQGEALPALAIGAALGTVFMTQFGQTEE
jgi:hypothetical protein